MEIGGAEISLIGLLQSIDYTLCDVDLFVYRHTGELMEFIPKEVNLLPEIGAYTQIECPLRHTLFSRYWRIGVARLQAKWLFWRYRRRSGADVSHAYFQYMADCITPHLPSLKGYGTYDLAINFIGMMNVVRDKVDARKKITWIHTDYSTVKLNAELELPVWRSFDCIASISPDVTKTFLKTFPSLTPKIIEIENILSPEFVRRRADLFSAEDELASYCTRGG